MAGDRLAYSVVPSPGHDVAGHYENAKRVPAILEVLQQKRLTAAAQPQKVHDHDLHTCTPTNGLKQKAHL